MNLGAILAAAALCSVSVAADASTRSTALNLVGDGDRGTITYRVTLPTTGRALPILLFSHGSGYSGDDYRVLADYWADHGFVVVQPTHLDTRTLALAENDPRRATIWHSRRDDLVVALDHWPELRRQAHGALDRADPTRVVAAGHSFGGHSVALLAGMIVRGAPVLADPRVRGVVLLSPPGGYDGLAEAWRTRAPYLDADWSEMRVPAVTIIGERDRSAMSSLPASWHADAYRRAPGGNACLVMLTGVGHFLGGISGQALTLPQDPSDPAAVAITQRVSLAFLRRAAFGRPLNARTFTRSLPRGPGVAAAECR